ncbi:MAG: diaminopimelate decarboxylase [Acidobacteria bacterium]|nr:MAG: diaminopimelate decarboxylase [Acidobacteriota bacterium]
MTGFFRDRTTLTCDGVPIGSLARSAGTPLYVYSAAAIREAYRALDTAFASYPHTIHYALKANSTLAIVRLLQGLGSHADANSGGEIEVALRAGFTPEHIVFTGVGKTHDELVRAVGLGLKAINVESPGELDRIARIAADRGTRARVALRVNPDIDSQTHPYIATGLRESKFGVPIELAAGLFREMASRPSLHLAGIHLHLGSQIVTLDPLRRAAEALVGLARELCDAGIRLEYLDLGGGLGISYDEQPVPSAEDYAASVLPAVRGSGLAVVLEPGRRVVGAAGALVASVVDTKQFPGSRRFVVLDAGMSELIRPALYGAFHRIVPVEPCPGPLEPCDIVGPVCESSDVFGRDRLMPPLEPGDVVALLDAGAYGSAMASNYLRRPLPAEVLVDNGGWQYARRRQTMAEMLGPEEETSL